MNPLTRVVLLSLCLAVPGATAQTTLPGSESLEPLPPSTDASTIPARTDCSDCESDFAVSILRSGTGPGQLRVMVAISNQGPDEATGVELALETVLPGTTTMVAVDAEPGSHFEGESWTIEQLPVNGSAVLILDFRRDDDGPPERVILSARVVAASSTIVNGNDDIAMLTTEIGNAEAGEVVAGVAPLSLSPEDPTLPAGTQWERYRGIKLVASGGTPPLHLRLRGAPEGLGYLGLGGTLTLAGTPRESGEFTLVVTLEDAQDPPASLTREYQLEIAEGMAPPPQTFSPTPAPEATPEEIPAGEVDQPVDESTGEVPPEETDQEAADPATAPAPSSRGDTDPDRNASTGLSDLGSSSGIGNNPDTIGDQTDLADGTVADTVADTGGTTVIDDGSTATAQSSTLSFKAPLPGARVGQPFDAEVLLGRTEDAELTTNHGLLPPGLAVRADNIAGLPAQAGEYTFSLRGKRLNEQISRGYTLEVAANSVRIPPQALPTPAVDSAYRARLRALGGRPPYRWRAEELPVGFSLSASGLLAAEQPTARTEQRFRVVVSDALGREARGELTLPGAVNAPVLQQASLPPLLVGRDYRLSLPFSGATAPYTCRPTGGLPQGLQLSSDCLLSGTPGQAGIFEIALTVADSATLSRTDDISLSIQVHGQSGIDNGVPFRLEPEPLLPVVPDSPEGASFSALAVDAFGARTAVGHGRFEADNDLQLVRYSPDGQYLWREGLAVAGDDMALDAAASPLDRSLWVVGHSGQGEQSRSLVAHFSAVGELLGEILRPHPQRISALHAVAADQQGIYAVGVRQEDGQSRGTVLALAPDGSLRWERTAEGGASIGHAVALLGCSNEGCTTVVAAGESGDGGWIQRLDAETGEVDSELAVSVPVPVRDLVRLNGGTLALASGTADTPLLLLDEQLNPRCQASPAPDTELTAIAADTGSYVYLAGQRNSSGRALLWVYDNQCQRRMEVPLTLSSSRVAAATLGIDQRLSLVGERDGGPLLVDLNSGRAF